jgi:ABC-type microcin C transport system duplicated ATPase subunit YejF
MGPASHETLKNPITMAADFRIALMGRRLIRCCERMQNGLIVEEGAADAVLRRPTNPYAQRLIASLPVPP